MRSRIQFFSDYYPIVPFFSNVLDMVPSRRAWTLARIDSRWSWLLAPIDIYEKDKAIIFSRESLSPTDLNGQNR